MRARTTVLLATFSIGILVGAMSKHLALQHQFHDYVALGDSFSTGIGAGGNAVTGPDLGQDCQRSTDAWPYLLAAELDLKSPHKFMLSACAGLNASQIRDYEILDPKAHFGSPDLVSVTMGANDMAVFERFVQTCVRDKNCGRALAELREFVGAGAAFSGDLGATLLAAGTHSPPPAPLTRTVLVMGYPAPFNFDTRWSTRRPDRIDAVINSDSRRRVDEIINVVNSELQDLVDGANNAGFNGTGPSPFRAVWVDPNEAFMGHRLCEPSGKPFLRGLYGIINIRTLGNIMSIMRDWKTVLFYGGVFHPNQDGQSLLASLARDALAALPS